MPRANVHRSDREESLKVERFPSEPPPPTSRAAQARILTCTGVVRRPGTHDEVILHGCLNQGSVRSERSGPVRGPRRGTKCPARKQMWENCGKLMGNCGKHVKTCHRISSSPRTGLARPSNLMLGLSRTAKIRGFFARLDNFDEFRRLKVDRFLYFL